MAGQPPAIGPSGPPWWFLYGVPIALGAALLAAGLGDVEAGGKLGVPFAIGLMGTGVAMITGAVGHAVGLNTPGPNG